MKKLKGVLKYLAKVITSTLLILLVTIGLALLFVFVSAKVAKSKGQTPPISLFTIISPSMTPNINVYDVVIAVRTDPTKLKKGEVISFYTNAVDVGGLTVTHRIHEKVYQGDLYGFQTKGDYNSYVDKWVVLPKDIVGKVIFKIPQLGRVQFFLGSKGGWILAIMIPALAIISYDIYKILKLVFIKQKIVAYQKQEDLKENQSQTITSLADMYKETSNAIDDNEIINIDDNNDENTGF